VVRLISVAVSGVLGAILAALAAYGVVTANTAAPAHNPANNHIVSYGQ